MTEEEKQGALTFFSTVLQSVESQDISTELRNRAQTFIDHSSGNPAPYITAALSQLEEANRRDEVKSNLTTKANAAIEFIKSTPASELSHELIKAHMDKI